MIRYAFSIFCLFFCSLAASSLEKKFVEAKEASLFCRYAGPEESKAPPIVVIHGGPGMSQDYFLPHLERLGKDRRVIFYDQRGCGQSTGKINTHAITIENYIDDLEKIREAFGGSPIVVVGHSWGGFLAMRYAIAHPEAVDKLVLVNTMAASSDDLAFFLQEWERRMKPHQEEIAKIKRSTEFLAGQTQAVSNYYRLMFRAYCAEASFADRLDLTFSAAAALDGFKVNDIFLASVFMKKYDHFADLSKLKIPTLVIHGDKDMIPVATAEHIQQKIAGARLVVLEQCGHFPFVEKPEPFFAALEEFLGK